ncbi:hypothetical protein Gohar_009222, partial [Gossypium harknessii]|nr:hypothetical protein [Gossypium harknessii]
GGCFWANHLAVFASLPSLSLSSHLGDLAGDPGCFPLDDEAYPSSYHWLTLTSVILRTYLVFRVFLDLVLLSQPAPKQLAFTTALVGSLNQVTAYESSAHSSKGTRSEPTAWELTESTCLMLLELERKLVMISATRPSLSRAQHFTASPSKDTATREPGTTESFPPSNYLVLRMSDCPSSTFTAQPENGDLRWGNLEELPTPTIVHVRSILDLTNRPSYLFYILDNPSLSQ